MVGTAYETNSRPARCSRLRAAAARARHATCSRSFSSPGIWVAGPIPAALSRSLTEGMAADLELAVSVAMLAASVGFAVGLAIGRGRQPRWEEKGSFVHKVSIGFATLDRLDAVLLRFEIETGSRLAGVEVDELRLPTGSAVSLVTRNPAVFVPEGRTVLRAGDHVLAVAARDQVGLVEERLRSVSRYGRLAGWHETLEATPSVRKRPA